MHADGDAGSPHGTAIGKLYQRPAALSPFCRTWDDVRPIANYRPVAAVVAVTVSLSHRNERWSHACVSLHGARSSVVGRAG